MPVNGMVELENIFNQRKIVKAKIKEMVLL
ncbi:MAG TPA: CooT family nickel-binding protein [Pseudobacteroides sp.]